MPTTSELAPIDFDQLVARCLGNQDVVARVLDKFIANSRKQVAALAAAVTNHDLVDAARLAHLIKGMSGNVAAERVSALAAGVERAALDEQRDTARRRLNELTAAIEAACAAGITHLGQLSATSRA